jgi:hypothetical protein
MAVDKKHSDLKVKKPKSMSNETEEKSNMWPVIVPLIVLAVLLVGIIVSKIGTVVSEKVASKKVDNVVSLSPAPEVVEQPKEAEEQPTEVVEQPKMEVDLAKYEIKVLNGSGVGGEAGRQKNNLEGEGFTVASVGDAANSDYSTTIIQAKEGVDRNYLDKLKAVLASSSFVLGDQEELSENADYDIIVILGRETN